MAKSIIMMAFFFTMPIKQDDADHGDDAELDAADEEREDGADAGRGQGGEDGDRMDVALVEDAQDDVDGDERGEDQDRLVGERGLEGLGGALERRAGSEEGSATWRSAAWMAVDGVAERDAGRQIEGERDGRELALVTDGQRGVGRRELGERAERHLGAGARTWRRGS